MFTPSGCKDIGIEKIEIVTKLNPFHVLFITSPKTKMFLFFSEKTNEVTMKFIFDLLFV